MQFFYRCILTWSVPTTPCLKTSNIAIELVVHCLFFVWAQTTMKVMKSWLKIQFHLHNAVTQRFYRVKAMIYKQQKMYVIQRIVAGLLADKHTHPWITSRLCASFASTWMHTYYTQYKDSPNAHNMHVMLVLLSKIVINAESTHTETCW